MMTWLRRVAIVVFGRYGESLRFPHLLLLSAALLVLDLVIPDGIPFFDEVVLALATLLFASWKQVRDKSKGIGQEVSPASGAGVEVESRSDSQPR